MSLLSKRRSQSESHGSRPIPEQSLQRQTISRHRPAARILGRYRVATDRKRETDDPNLVNNSYNSPSSNANNARILSTQRPITPREPGRVLYGKVGLDGRPPSAISMHNLYVDKLYTTPPQTATQAESKPGKVYGKSTEGDISLRQLFSTARRSQSLESCFDYYNQNKVFRDGPQTVPPNKLALPRKLPAIEIQGLTLKPPDSPDLRLRSKTADTNASQLYNDQQTDLSSTRPPYPRTNALLSQTSIEGLIEMLKEHAGLKECTEDTADHINSILIELHRRIYANEKQFKKGFILGGLYGLVEANSPKILLAVAGVILALRVSGSNLTGACKLIFKVARHEQNDHLFHGNNVLELLVDGLGRASPLEDPEACIYGYGAIRFLTCSTSLDRAELTSFRDLNPNCLENQIDLPRKPATAPALGEYRGNTDDTAHKQNFRQKLNKQDALVVRLARQGAVQLMILHLQMLNEVGARKKLTGPPLHSLYQLSAALRALAGVHHQSSTTFETLHYDGQNKGSKDDNNNKRNIQLELACPHLVKAAEIAIGETEVQANIVRTLSVLSEDEICCDVLAQFTSRIGMLLGSCYANSTNNLSGEKSLTLASRLGYILGNIMAKYDKARLQFYNNDVAMEYLIGLLEMYIKQPLTLHNSLGDTVTDVLIKLIRVVANMSVNAEVGSGLSNTISSLGYIFMELLKLLQIKDNRLFQKPDLQELLHVITGALHNLCFYQDQTNHSTDTGTQPRGTLQNIWAKLAKTFCNILKSCQDEAIQMEIVRVLGNLTRNHKARKYFSKSKGLPIILQILANSANDGECYDLKACAIGILVNVLGDNENRLAFIQLKGCEILLILLKEAVQHYDWFLASVICQAFWNLFIDSIHMEDLCSSEFLDNLNDLLLEHIDDEKIKGREQTLVDVNDNNKGDIYSDVWENFAVVASDLLERLQSNYDQYQKFMMPLANLENTDNNEVYVD